MKKILSELFTHFGFYLLSSSFGEGYHILSKKQADNLYTNYKSRFFEVGGQRLHYRDEGKGFPIVMLHGFSASLHVWEDWVDELSDKYRLIRIDLPGFGLSDLPPKNKIVMSHYMHCIKSFLDYLGVDKCHFVGNSFGGWLSWEFALLYPERVKRLVLISSAGYFTPETAAKTVEFMQKPIFKELLKSGIPRFVIKRILANSYGDKTKVSEHDVNRYYGLANREGNLLSMAKLANSPIVSHPKDIKKISQPTLIMWGTLDRIIKVTDAFKFNKDIKNSKLMIYKGAGHIPQVEIPKRSLKDLLSFLKEG